MKKFLIILFFLLTFTSVAQASVLNISLDKDNIKSGYLTTMTVILDTEGKSINTIEGDLVYNKDLLKIEKINTGNSFINFWVDKPNIDDTGRIHFSGIIPGGISISKGEIMSVVFRGEKDGQSNLSLENVSLFLNDGEASVDRFTVKNQNIQITKNSDGSTEEIDFSDLTSPDKFKITRTHDSSIYRNQWFIVFDTQDKGSGIDHYLICEFFKRSCTEGRSPYLLKYQNKFYHISVTAYDGEGNIQKSLLVSPYLIILIVLLFIFLLFFLFYFFSRYLKKY